MLLQLLLSYMVKFLAAVKEKQNESEQVNYDIRKVNERPVFYIESKPLKLVRTNGYHKCFPANVSLNQIYMLVKITKSMSQLENNYGETGPAGLQKTWLHLVQFLGLDGQY